MVPFKHPVNNWLVTGLQNSYFPPPMADQSLGTPYEPVRVIEIVLLDRMEVGFKQDCNKKQIPYLAVGGILSRNMKSLRPRKSLMISFRNRRPTCIMFIVACPFCFEKKWGIIFILRYFIFILASVS